LRYSPKIKRFTQKKCFAPPKKILGWLRYCVGAITWEWKEYFVHISPNLPEKLLCDKLFPYNFAVAVVVHYIFLYYVGIELKIEYLALEISFLIAQLKKKATPGCARTLSEVRWLNMPEHLPDRFEVFN